MNVADNDVPNTPDYTAMFGSQLSRSLGADFRCSVEQIASAGAESTAS